MPLWDYMSSLVDSTASKIIGGVVLLVALVGYVRSPAHGTTYLVMILIAVVVLQAIDGTRRIGASPKLALDFDPNNAYATATISNWTPAPPPTGYFCQVLVKNESSTDAKQCWARVVKFRHQNSSGEFVDHPDFRSPRWLKWANEQDERLDVESDVPRRVDLCYGLSSQANAMIGTKVGPQGTLIQFPPGVYRALVRVKAENSERSADRWFEIDHTRGWNQIEVRPV